MYRVGGSLTEINMNKTEEIPMSGQGQGVLSGGGLVDDIMKGADAMNNLSTTADTPGPKIPIPDTFIKEDILPDTAMTNAILEQARTMDDSSFSASAILNAIFVYIAKLLFVVFEIDNKMLHNGLLALVWLCIGGLLFLIASGISNTNITFILYCCALWIMALAVLFVIIQPYRKGV